MKKSTKFDYSTHNKKIAGLRGKDWRRKLSQAKLGETLLAQTRFKKGFTQESILPQLGINTQATYARIERAKALASKPRAEKISQILNVPINKLFVEVEPNRFLAL